LDIPHRSVIVEKNGRVIQHANESKQFFALPTVFARVLSPPGQEGRERDQVKTRSNHFERAGWWFNLEKRIDGD
jgi:hypothetical protein